MKRIPILLAMALAAVAQETPTEREAARDVLRKMNELERSLDVPTLVERLSAANPARADGEGTAGAFRRHYAASRDRIRGNPFRRETHHLSEAARIPGNHGRGQPQDRVRRAL